MSHVTRRTQTGLWNTCPACGKRGFHRKSDAKVAARRVDPRMKVYPCVDNPTVYHFGHKPPGRSRQSYRDRARSRV